MTTKSQLAESRSVQYLEFPAVTKVTNFHLWFLFVAKMLFEEYKLTPSFVVRCEREYSSILPILESLHHYHRRNQSFAGMINVVTSFASTEDMTALIDYGTALQLGWKERSETLEHDVDEFLSEEKMPHLPTSKAAAKYFREWYEYRFEPTSAPHFTAYLQRARGKYHESDISLLMTMYPPTVRTIAVPVFPGSTSPDGSCNHVSIKWVSAEKVFRCVRCGVDSPSGRY